VTKTKALVMTRVSSSGQLESSPEQQADACRIFCKAKGWEVVELPKSIRRDISGTNEWEDRPDYHEAVRLYAAGKVDCIVTAYLDRATRNYTAMEKFITTIFDVRHRYDIWDASTGQQFKKGDFATGVRVLAAAEHAKSIFTRSYTNKVYRIANGEWGFGGDIRTGYRRVYADFQTGSRRRCVGVEPDPARIELARNIFRWYASGLGFNAIATRLKAEGIQSPAAYLGKLGGKKTDTWTQTTVKNILRDTIYIGELRVWQNAPTKKALDNEFVRDTVVFKVEPLIDMKTWNTVQRRLTEQHARSPRTGNRLNEEWALQRRVWCECGALFQKRGTKHTAFMQCLVCRAAGIKPSRIIVDGKPLRRVEASTHPKPILPLVVKGLHNLTARPQEAVRRSVADIDARIAELGGQLGPANKNLASLEKAKSRLVKLAKAGMMDDAEFDAEMKSVQDQQAALSRKTTRKQAELAELEDLKEQRDRLTSKGVAHLVDELGTAFTDKDGAFRFQSIHALLDVLNVRIVVHHSGQVVMSGRILGGLGKHPSSAASCPRRPWRRGPRRRRSGRR